MHSILDLQTELIDLERIVFIVQSVQAKASTTTMKTGELPVLSH